MLAILPLLITGSGCAILLGNVKPVSQKSEDYTVLDLSKDNADWVKLETPKTDPEAGSEENTDQTDLGYQSKRTASIISLNSACREKFRSADYDLREFTDQLVLGITDVTQRTERELTLQKKRARETTLQGKMGRQNVKLRVVVLKNESCIYDLMYVARPESFSAQEPDFSRFIESLRLR